MIINCVPHLMYSTLWLLYRHIQSIKWIVNINTRNRYSTTLAVPFSQNSFFCFFLFCPFRTLLAWSSLRGWKPWARARSVALCWWGTEKRDSIMPWRSSTSRRSVRARGQEGHSVSMYLSCTDTLYHTAKLKAQLLVQQDGHRKTW